MLSNLHSFHFGNVLQNISALPDHVYRSANNRQLLRLSNAGLTTMPTGNVIKLRQEQTRQTQQHPVTPAASETKTKTSAHAEPENKVHSRSTPVTQKTALPPAPPPLPVSSVRKKQVWKPGRGVVEKVDKASGEIVHLCLE
jgi:type IV secretory pathway VirB10-like protein